MGEGGVGTSCCSCGRIKRAEEPKRHRPAYFADSPSTHHMRRVPDFWSVTGSPLKRLICQATMSSFWLGEAVQYLPDLTLGNGRPSGHEGSCLGFQHECPGV